MIKTFLSSDFRHTAINQLWRLVSGDPYAASKGAISSLVKSLTLEFAPNIRVVGIAPGITDNTDHPTQLFDPKTCIIHISGYKNREIRLITKKVLICTFSSLKEGRKILFETKNYIALHTSVLVCDIPKVNEAYSLLEKLFVR